MAGKFQFGGTPMKMSFDGFFDRAQVMAVMSERTRSALSQLGALTRRLAMQSIKDAPRGTYSRPGSPPFSHSGEFKRFILFAFDQGMNEMLVGAALFASTKSKTPVPELLEYGGNTTDWKGRGRDYPARPHMRPAMRRALSAKNVQEAFDRAGAGNLPGQVKSQLKQQLNPNS